MCARNVVLMLVLLRAHTEVRPYRLIVPVVLHFLLLVLALASGEAERVGFWAFLLLVGGGQEGIVRHTLRFLRINPPLLHLS